MTTVDSTSYVIDDEWNISAPVVSSDWLTKDDKQQAKIRKFVGKHVNTLPDKQYQFKLSKELCFVECTETGNAIRFAARYGHQFRFQAETKEWVMWNGRYWEEDKNGVKVQSYAMKVAAYIDMEADLLPPPTDSEGNLLVMPLLSPVDVPTPEQKAILDKFAAHEKHLEALKKWAQVSRSKKALCDMVELFKSMDDITMDKAQFDTDKLLLNCQNGVFDLKTGQVIAHDRYLFMSKIIGVNAVPGAECPKWLNFLVKVMLGNAELVDYLQQLAGMGLTGEVYEDLFPVFYGKGGNGKTVYIKVLCQILHDYAKMGSQELFMEQKNDRTNFELARLDGVRLLIKDETKQGRALDESLVKSMTGGAAIAAEQKFKDPYEYTPQFSPVLLTNHKPRITGNDEGIWRRVKLIPWEYSFDGDPEKKSKPEAIAELIAEAEGVFMWMYAGLRRLLTEGYSEPETVKIKTQEYRASSDVIGAFIEEKCYLADKISLQELYNAYRTYAEEESGNKPYSKINFGEMLLQRGFQKARGTGGTWQWLGIRLREISDPVPETPKPSPETPKPASSISPEMDEVKNFLTEFYARGEGYYLRREGGKIVIGVPESMSEEEYNAIADFVGAHERKFVILLWQGWQGQ